MNFRSPQNVITTVKDEAYQIFGGTNGALEIFTPKGKSSPMLRTVFTSPDTGVVKARLYVTARGIYEIYINGQRVERIISILELLNIIKLIYIRPLMLQTMYK